MTDNAKRFSSLAEYVERNGMKKIAVAGQLGVSRYQMSALLYPERYAMRIDDALVGRIAKLLNQSHAFVRRIYERAA